MQLFGRKQKFVLGVLLVIWPIVVTALLPSEYFSSLDMRFLSSDRIPAAYFSFAAFLSEAFAILLFFRAHRRLRDRLSSWSVIGVAAAGAATLAFLAATVANAMQVW
jgi:MFS family permease